MRRRVLRVSVIVPAFNAAATLDRCLHSLQAQSRLPAEVIVVDDASTDSTAEVAARHPVSLIRRPARGGAGAARSDGARVASGEIVAFLDADCLAPTDWVARLAAEFEADATLGGVGGLYDYPPSRSVVEHLCRVEAHCEDRARENPLTNDPQGGNSAFLRELWAHGRSGMEQVVFARMAGGEDRFVWEELGRQAKLKKIETPKVTHLWPGLGGYLRRHFHRGQSGLARMGLSGHGAGTPSLRMSGGARVLAGSVLLAAAGVGLPFWCLPPVAALGVEAVLLAGHWACTRDFFALSQEAGCGPIPWTSRQAMRLLLVLRYAAWAAGAAVMVGRRLAGGVNSMTGSACGVAGLWRRGRLWRLFFFVTARCNARCEFCCNQVRAKSAGTGSPELSLEEIEQVARKLGRLSYLTLTGGEPFLRRDLAEIAKLFHAHCRTRWVTLTTNGTLPEQVQEQVRRILTEAPQVQLAVQVSLDDVGAGHDASRALPGAFEKVADTLRLLGLLRRQHGHLRVQIATPFHGGNPDRIRWILDECRSRFEYDQHVLYLVRTPGSRWTDENNALLAGYEDAVRYAAELDRAGMKGSVWNRGVKAIDGVVSADAVRAKRTHRYLYPCRAGGTFATLYENGDMAACEVRSDTALGNVRDHGYDVPVLLKGAQAQRVRQESILEARCCCDWPCALQVNLLLNPGGLLRTVWRALARNSPAGAGRREYKI